MTVDWNAFIRKQYNRASACVFQDCDVAGISEDPVRMLLMLLLPPLANVSQRDRNRCLLKG